MKKVLITGATGNVGREAIAFLQGRAEIYAAVRDIEKAKKELPHEGLHFRSFDFEEESTHARAFKEIEVLFLLRPPHISDVNKVFKPLLQNAKKAGIKKVVFLSVQGVEKSSIIPHHKIEALIPNLGFTYIFMRPGYFMQNLTTTLWADLSQKRKIILPAGKAKFNWIDVKDIGEVSAALIAKFEDYANQAFEITGPENLNFYQAAEILSKASGVEIKYQPKNPLNFFFYKKKRGMKTPFILVMIMLHFLPRFQAEPKISPAFEGITGHKPARLKDFALRIAHNIKMAATKN